jgi:hypothetical protein
LSRDFYPACIGAPRESFEPLQPFSASRSALQLQQRINYFTIVTVGQLNYFAGSRHDRAEGFGREMGGVFVEEVCQTVRLEYAVYARHFCKQPAWFFHCGSSPSELLQEHNRFGEMFQHMPNYYCVRSKSRHVRPRFE